MLGIFTLCQSYLTGLVCSLTHDPELVLVALVLTLGVVLSLTLYTFSIKDKDLTFLGATGSMIISATATLGICSFFFRFNSSVTMLYTFLGIMSFGYYIIYDLLRIMGGKAGEYSVDDYVKASMTLYQDIISMFVRILRFLNELKSKEEKNKRRR